MCRKKCLFSAPADPLPFTNRWFTSGTLFQTLKKMLQILFCTVYLHNAFSTMQPVTELTSCNGFRSLNTTYSNDPNVPPYTGIFFEVAAINSLEILTLELDVVDYEDLRVEVYSVGGSFQDLHHDPSAWDLIANTTLVRAPEGTGAIVPLDEFSPIQLFARQKASLYVTMDAPKLDHSVFALSKTGDVHMRNADLQVFVGAGTHSYKFPETLDTILDPMFAGVIHYETSQCENSQVTTNVQYSFLVDMEPEQFRNVLNGYLDSLLKSDLKDFVNKYNLRQSTIGTPVPVAYPYVCPDTWKDCPSEYLQTQVSWTHSNSLSSGLLKYELFRPEALVTLDAKFLHLGFSSTAAQLTLRFEGAVLSSHDVKYVEDVTKHFLELTVSNKAFVWDVAVSPEEARLGHSGTSKVNGVIRGAVPTATKAKEFRFAIDNAFRSDGDLFEKLLADSASLRPGYEKSSAAFENFSRFEVTISPYDHSLEQTLDSSGMRKAVVYACGAVGVVSFLLGLYLLYRRQKKVLERRQQREADRKRRKEERRARKKNRSVVAPSKKEQAKVQRDDSITDLSFQSHEGIIAEVTSDLATSDPGVPGGVDLTLSANGATPQNDKNVPLHDIPNTAGSARRQIISLDSAKTRDVSFGGYKIGNYSTVNVG